MHTDCITAYFKKIMNENGLTFAAFWRALEIQLQILHWCSKISQNLFLIVLTLMAVSLSV